MRFKQFLIEEPGELTYIPKQKKANQQRNRNATKARAQANQAKMQAASSQKPRGRMINGKFVPLNSVNTGLDQKQSGQMPNLDFNTGQDLSKVNDNPSGLERRSTPTGPDNVNLKGLTPELIQHAKGNRQDAVEMITLLGAMYQTLRRNPSVQMTPPKIVTQSKNQKYLQSLFDIAKDMDLPQLARLSQEVKQQAATPGIAPNNIPPKGTQNTQTSPNQTSGGKTLLQSLMNKISQAAKTLSPMELMQLRKKIDKAAQTAKPNPSNPPQSTSKPVVTQG